MTSSGPHGRRRLKTKRPQRTALVISICSLIVIGAFLYVFYIDANPGVHLVLDWRFHLVIHNAATKENLTIPANIGVANGIWLNHTFDQYGPPGYAPLSTRDTSGTVYVQSMVPRLYVLSDFFSIWGQVYNRTCVGIGSGPPYCSSAKPPVASNGVHEYYLAYCAPPMDREKSWEIIINTAVPANPPGC